MVRFEEWSQLNPATLENPDQKTERWIRRLANELKSQNRIDLFKYLRTLAPPGTTGEFTTKLEIIPFTSTSN